MRFVFIVLCISPLKVFFSPSSSMLESWRKSLDMHDTHKHTHTIPVIFSEMTKILPLKFCFYLCPFLSTLAVGTVNWTMESKFYPFLLCRKSFSPSFRFGICVIQGCLIFSLNKSRHPLLCPYVNCAVCKSFNKISSKTFARLWPLISWCPVIVFLQACSGL